MLRPRSVLCLPCLCLLACAAEAMAQQAPRTTYQKPQTSSFHVDGLSRQEWTDEITFVAKSRRMFRLRPRAEVELKWLQLGVGGDFIYSSDHNTDPPAGQTTLPLLRDNYKSRDARLDLAWGKLTPFHFISVQGGRFAMPVRFTEMIWDRDLRAQGGAATLDFGSLGPVRRFAVTGVYTRGSHILPAERAFKLKDRDTAWMGSATAVLGAGAKDQIELLGTFVKFTDLGFVDPRLRRQNTRIGGALALPYEIVDLVARYRSEGRMSTLLVADYCWNRAISENNRGLWLAIVLGSTDTARGSLEYTYAKVDKDATLAAYATDDFLWQTGWAGHRADLGLRMSDRTSSHVVGQLQRFKDSPNPADRDTYLKRLRIEVRISY
jgi:hypothetical protein